MRQTAYIRVSTQAQSYDRQMLEFREYFKRRGIDPDKVRYVTEKVSSYTSFRNREIFKLIKDSEPGDIIYACQLDRFGRTVQDVLDLVDFAMSRGVELITLDGHTIENRTPMGKMILTMLAAFAEMERSLRAERCAAGKEAEREELRKHGYRIARCSGKIQTRMGNDKGVDMSAANEASRVSRANSKMIWRSTSPGYKWVMDKIRAGVPRPEVIAEFNRLHEINPEVFSTPTGRPLSKGTLSQWLRDERM